MQQIPYLESSKCIQTLREDQRGEGGRQGQEWEATDVVRQITEAGDVTG